MDATRLYASAIAIASGLYSLFAAGDPMMPMRMPLMTVLGAVVVLHGIVLLTPLAERLGRVSGPLMLLWAALMLGNQALAGMMSWDPGMVALATLMLVSGLIMSRSRAM